MTISHAPIQTAGPRMHGAPLNSAASVVHGVVLTTAPLGPSEAEVAGEDEPWNASYARNPGALSVLAERAREQVRQGKFRKLRSDGL